MRSILSRRSWPLFFVLLISGFALVAAACGGDSDDNGSADNGGTGEVATTRPTSAGSAKRSTRCWRTAKR